MRAFYDMAILIVDDESFVTGVIERLLRQDGYTQITTITDPREAAAILARQDFDLILLDIHMPHIGGLEILERFRTHGFPAPVIVLTGDEDMETRFAALDLGARDFLVKPPRKAELLCRVRNTLEAERLLHSVEAERQKNRQMLENILPQYIIERLNAGARDVADEFPDTAVLFADLVGFSTACTRLDAAIIVKTLNTIFQELDARAAHHRIEKIKTIGDAYMAITGLSGDDETRFQRMAHFALDAVRTLDTLQPVLAVPFQLRIGIGRGPLVAGVLQGQRSAFDVWGDTVNTAARLESASVPGRITVSQNFADAVRTDFNLEPRGTLNLKGVGATKTYYLLDAVPS